MKAIEVPAIDGAYLFEPTPYADERGFFCRTFDADVVRSVGLDHWWGAFDGARLVSLIGITAMHETIAQIGGVFTVPELRRTGLSRDVMVTLMRDAHLIQRLDRLFLFTGEENMAARKMYEALGFESFGHFGLFFGE